MLFTIGIILLVLWLVGLLTAYTLGGFIYVALAVGVILLIVGFVRRSRTHHETPRFATGGTDPSTRRTVE